MSSNDTTSREQQTSDQTMINTSCTTAFSKFCKHSLRESPQDVWDAPMLVPLISYDNQQRIPPQSTSSNVELEEHNKAIHRATRERSKGMLRCKINGENYASIQETFRSIEESILITPMSSPYVESDPIQFRCLHDKVENLVGDHDRKSLSELDISQIPPSIAAESVPYQDNLPDKTTSPQTESDTPSVLPLSTASVPYRQDDLPDKTTSQQNESEPCGQYSITPFLDSHRTSSQSTNKLEPIHTSIPSDPASNIICPEVQSKQEKEQVMAAQTSSKLEVSDAAEESQYGVHSTLAPTGYGSTLLELLNQKHPTTTICLPKKDLNFANKVSSPTLQPLHIIPQFDRSPIIDDLLKLLHEGEYTMIIQFVRDIDSISHHQYDFMLLHFVTGMAEFKLTKYKEAYHHFQQCEHTAKQVLFDEYIMLCNAYLGDIEYADKSYSKAAQYYKAAIKNYSSEIENLASMLKLIPPTLSAIHAKRASTFRNMSNLVEAINEYRTAIDTAQTDENRLSAHTSLGNVYQCMNENSRALEEYNISIALAEKLGDYVTLGWIHGNIGNAHLGLNEKDKSIYHFLKSLDLAKEYERTPQAIGRAYNSLGTAYQSMNNFDKAEEYYDLALAQAVYYGNDIACQALVYGNIGNIHMLRKNYERAILHYSEVLQLSIDPATIKTAQHNRGCAYYEWATSMLPPDSKNLHIHGSNCNHDCLIPHEVQELYRKGVNDLEEVVNYHEQRFQHIKESHKDLTLSVSLFEANSRTFHRLQDCLVNLHRWDEALVVAERSRVRTLGELMVKKNADNGGIILPPPKLSFDAIVNIISRLKCPLVYLSYTGSRLLGWVFVVSAGKPTMNSFEVHLSNDQFEGKSFDYYLQYTLTEKLVERSFDIYQGISYNEDSNSSVQMLHQLIIAPIEEIINRNLPLAANSKQIICIPDGYTTLLPLVCLYDATTGSFFGDRFCLRFAPSLLSLGILGLVSESRITLEDEKQEVCVIGDPCIPPFELSGEVWNLGRLPYARREAEWVAHILQTTPILNENATKTALLNQAMGAKLIHIATHGSASNGFSAPHGSASNGFSATHGSASNGFLAFAPIIPQCDQYRRVPVSSENVLLYPADVENLRISPALVVLSSCDSGRGTVKVDSIQGMARAFILAGARSVLTTMWKIPDESASIFMQFFYKYLLDGYQSSLAIQKAILSIRCFAKYSKYIHWGGYQLTGVDVEFHSSISWTTESIKNRLGKSSSFPRIAEIKKLEKALVNNPLLPTDVQMLRGSVGVDPSEVAIDFITSYHTHFSGGIFWIDCQWPEMIRYSIENIEKSCRSMVCDLPLSEVKQILIVFESVTNVSAMLSKPLLQVLKSKYTHIVIIFSNALLFDTCTKLVNDIDRLLVRGCTIHDISPLSMTHSTQRMVYNLMVNLNSFAPTNDDQHAFQKLADNTLGSPPIVDLTSQVMINCYKDNGHQAPGQLENLLLKPKEELEDQGDTREPILDLSKYSTVHWKLNSTWNHLIRACNLSPEEHLLLRCLAVLGHYPLPFSLVTSISSVIMNASHQSHLINTLHKRLMEFTLLRLHPSPVIIHNSLESDVKNSESNPEFVYIAPDLIDCVQSTMKEVDHAAVLATLFSSLSQFTISIEHFHLLKPLLCEYSRSQVLIRMDTSKKVIIALLQIQMEKLQMTDLSSQYFIASQIAQVPFFCHETFECNHNGYSYTNKHHGIEVIIPKGAITEGDKIHFEIGLTLYGQFLFPENTQPISPILWICSLERNVRLNEEFKIVLPHFLTGLSENNDELQVCFAKAKHNDFIIHNDEIHYRFESCVEELTLSTDSKGYSYGAIQTTHCCFYCLQAKRSPRLEADTTFCLARIKRPLNFDYEMHFVAVYFIQECMDAVEQQYPNVYPLWCKFKFKVSAESGVSPNITVVPDECKKSYEIAMIPKEAKIKESDINFWTRPCEELKLEHKKKLYPPRVIMTIMKHTNDSIVVPVKFEGCSEDSAECLDFDVPLPGVPAQVYNSFSTKLESNAGLNIVDHQFEVTQYLDPMERRDLIRLGTALGLSYHDLKKMDTLPDDMVYAWLMKKDNVIEKGLPTWTTLATALRKINQNGIAQDIEQKQLGKK